MQQYGVLVADDSSFMRRCISLIIEKDPQFFIIGIARNGQDAIEKVQRLKPDIVTMDVEMPEMDGLEALQEIMKTCPIPVIMLSNHTEEGAKTTIKALELGAVDFFLKTELVGDDSNSEVIDTLLRRMKTIAEGARLLAYEEMNHIPDMIQPKVDIIKSKKAEMLVIGCSTGGPSALQSLLPRFPKETNIPIIVIQHMPPGFTGPLAERFDTICNLHVKEAQDGDMLEAGTIYIAPAGFQTYLNRKSDRTIILKIEDYAPIETLYKPSVNVTLLSAAQIYKDRLVAVIMTGMGNDGLLGCEEVKKHQGRVIVESEESCIVYGMPKVVFEAGLADVQIPLPQIFQQIMQSL
jgi:two-component system, chemotaxis family, protein-glutamate methylesterase/glutaminase